MYTILTYPDKRLLAPSTKVESFDSSLRDSAIRMYKTMLAARGVGLAAPQVGIPQSFFVCHRNVKIKHNMIVNPSWSPAHDAQEYIADEGCLSFPNLFLKISRFTKINVQYQDINGKLHSDVLDGFAAHVFQHEEEHTRGVLMIHHANVQI